MLVRLLATGLIAALLLPVGNQAWLYGWFVLDNEAFTVTHCRNWEVEAPMCFGSCKIADSFVSVSSSSPEQLAPFVLNTELSQYCQLSIGAGSQVQLKLVIARNTERPVFFGGGQGRLYVGSVFWPPAV